MSESKELAKEVPPSEAIVRRYAETVAKSPMDIRPGEAVILDRHGIAFGRGRYQRIVSIVRAGIYGGMIGGIVLYFSGAILPGVLLYFASASPVWWAWHRGTGKLAAIDVIVRQGHLDEGQRRLDALPKLRRRNPVLYGWVAGSIASHRGDYSAALRWWREALPKSSGLRRELIKLAIVNALALSGQLAEARLTFETVQFPPDADALITGQTRTRVLLGLLDPSTMPSTDELHEWARTALAYSHTGVDLAAIGWAFERGGDDDMAHMLANEAVERMHYPYLATWWPALQHWLDNKRANTPPPTP